MFVNTMYEEIGSVSFSDPNLDAVQHITRTAAMSNFQVCSKVAILKLMLYIDPPQNNSDMCWP